MQKSRAVNTMINSFTGIAGQVLTLIFSFICRTFFIKCLGTQNLGYDALFSNILSVLSIVDLGITSALTYSLYSSLYEKKYSKTTAIVCYFRKIFFIIGILLLSMSLLISPFISYFVKINDGIDTKFIKLVFMMYAVNSFSTYFYVDMRTLLIADQKEYILSLADCAAKILTKIFQIYILYYFRDYILYMLIEIILAVVSNMIISTYVYKSYHIKDLKEQYILNKWEKKNFFTNIIYISLNKIANTGINSTDNVIISKLIGTTTLGIYSNYNLIIGTGYALIDKLIIGVTASLGNLFVEDEYKKQEEIIFNLQFIDSIFSSFVFIFLFIFTPQIIFLWLGKEMILSLDIVFVVCFNQYFYMTRKTLDLIMQAKGVFKQIVPIKVLEMTLNIIISIGLAIQFGMVGVFIGTTVSIIISFILVGKTLIKDVFHFDYRRYVLCQLKYFLVNMLCFSAIYFSLLWCRNIFWENIIFQFIISFILFIGINYLLYKNNRNYKVFKQYLCVTLRRRIV